MRNRRLAPGRARAVALLLAAGLLSGGCGGKPDAAAPDAVETVRGVEVVTVAAEPLERYAEAVGTVKARIAAAVAPQVMGRITGLFVSEGDRVAEGALIATIDDAQARAQLAAAEGAVVEAQAALEEAQAAVAQAQASMELAEKSHGRYRRLFEEKVITQQEYDEVTARRTVAAKEHERAQGGKARAQARIVQAREQANAARTMLGHTRLTAPFAGLVVEKKAEAGSMAVPGSPVVVLEDTNRYRMEAAVPESFLAVLRKGAKVQVTIDTMPGTVLPATVAEIVPSVDPASRTFTAKADISAPNLRSGIFGRLRFPAGKGEVLAVPQEAVSEASGYDALYVVGPDNTARLTLVRAGSLHGRRREILSGISAGARVAVSPVDRLRDGVRVEVRP